MKKFSLIMCAIAMMSVCFTSCGEKNPTVIEDIVENGFYVLGPATGYADLSAKGVAVCQMANGKNEVSKAEREGMYEKYIILEGGKDFTFIEKAGDKKVVYTAALQQTAVKTDGVDLEGGYFGAVSEGTATMKVEKTGLYHIVLDLNKDDLLKDAGGAQVIIAPVEWGVRGAMNGWSYTKYHEVSADGLTWTWKNQEMGADGAEFKFAHGNFWKINLDIAEQVKAEVSLGKDMVAGGGNIAVDARGVYDITLTFKLAKGAIANSFSYTATKVGDIQVKDYSNVELELVGSAVAEQDGAVVDEIWNWGNRLPLGKPAKNGDIYTWTKAGVKLAAGEYKVRTLENKDQGDIKAFDNGANIVVAADVTTDITVTVDATTGEVKVDDGSVPADPVDITVTATVPDGWTTCNIYAWNGAGNLCGEWPGKALDIKDGKVSYKFEKVVPPINVIFNTEGAQTNDITGISADKDIDIAANIKQ